MPGVTVLLQHISGWEYPLPEITNFQHSPESSEVRFELSCTFNPEGPPAGLSDFLLEETLRSGATRVAVDPNNKLFADIHKLEAKRRILEIGADDRAIAEVQALIKRIADEFGVEIYMDCIGGDAHSMDLLPSGLAPALTTFHQGLYVLALGIRHQLHISLDLDAFLAATNQVRRQVKNKGLRLDLAFLESVLQRYEPVSLPHVKFRSSADQKTATEIRELLQDALLDDPTYLRFSVFGHELGLLRHIRRAMTGLARSAKILLEHPLFRCIFDPTLKAVKIPLHGIGLTAGLPTATELQGLLRSEFLPPIVEPVRVPMTVEDAINIRLDDEALRHGLPSGAVRLGADRRSTGRGKGRPKRRGRRV